MSEAILVCECKEGCLSACMGMEFYREVEGRKYCVLHCPVQDKVDDFNVVFRQKLSSFNYDFRGVYFPTDISFAGINFVSTAYFSKATFSAAVDFREATFHAIASFISTKFGRAASFRKVTFSAEVFFRSAKFNDATNFSSAIFRTNAYFRSARFSAITYFSKAVFRATADFKSTRFNDNAHFSETTFGATAYFTSARFKTAAIFSSAIFTALAHFKSANFSGTAYFRLANFGATAYFDSAKFDTVSVFSKAQFGAAAFFIKVQFIASAIFDGVTFSGIVAFDEAVFGGAAMFRSTKIESYLRFIGKRGAPVFKESASLNLQLAQITKQEQVIFHTVQLRPSWFVNVDSRKFEFTNIDWGKNTFRNGLQALEKVGNHSRLLSIAYRQLATNAEDNNRYGEAAEFRYAAMEVRRLEQWYDWNVFTLDWWYWLMSGYGELSLKAAVTLIVILLLFSVPYQFVGFAPTKFLDQDKVGVPIRSSSKYENRAKRFIADTATACIYSLETASLQKPEPRPTTFWARFFVGLETILAPLQAALLALAVRRRFMR